MKKIKKTTIYHSYDMYGLGERQLRPTQVSGQARRQAAVQAAGGRVRGGDGGEAADRSAVCAAGPAAARGEHQVSHGGDRQLVRRQVYCCNRSVLLYCFRCTQSSKRYQASHGGRRTTRPLSGTCCTVLYYGGTAVLLCCFRCTQFNQALTINSLVRGARDRARRNASERRKKPLTPVLAVCTICACAKLLLLSCNRLTLSGQQQSTTLHLF